MKDRTIIRPCIAIVLIGVFLSGCASTQQLVPIATGPIATNSARIVVLPHQMLAAANDSISIADDGREIGTVGVFGQLLWDRPAGAMELTAFDTLNKIHGKTLRIGVGGEMCYQFKLCLGVDIEEIKHGPKLELVSGTPVACGTNTIAGTVEYVQPSVMSGEMKTAATASSASSISSGYSNVLGITVGPTSGTRGVRVIAVASGSPCEGVVKTGDTIFAFDLIGQGGSRVGGAKVNAGNFQTEVSKIQPGMTVKLLLDLRSLRQVTFTIPANTRPLAPQSR